MTVLAQDDPQSNRRGKNSDPDDIVISEWPLNNRETARVTLGLYKGARLINIRKWFQGDDGELKPGKGFAVGVKHLPRLAAALEQALAHARKRKLIVAEPGEGLGGVSHETSSDRGGQ